MYDHSRRRDAHCAVTGMQMQAVRQTPVHALLKKVKRTFLLMGSECCLAPTALRWQRGELWLKGTPEEVNYEHELKDE